MSSAISFKDSYQAEIERLLLKESFFVKPERDSVLVSEGILRIVDSLSDYREEGKSLSPDILVVSSVESLIAQFPHFKKIRIGGSGVPLNTINEFDDVLKACAPLAVGDWIIYLEVNQFSSFPMLEFGVLNGAMNVLSDSVYSQVFSHPENIEPHIKCALIQNIGQKTIQISGLKGGALTLSFSSTVTSNSPLEAVRILVQKITNKINGRFKKKTTAFLVKEIYEAVCSGHGTLIGVSNGYTNIDDSSTIGHTLRTPLNIAMLIEKTFKSKNPNDYYSLFNASQIMKAAICNDGITIFSEDAQILGYHFIIHDKSNDKTSGGARSQAFETMKRSNKFSCCFYRSQDGKTKVEVIKKPK